MISIAFLVLPDFAHLGLSAAIEPLFVANWVAQRDLFGWRVISRDGSAVRASNGMSVNVAGGLAEATACDAVFVLASFDTHQFLPEARTLAWLRRMARAGKVIGGIENGSLVLAEAGLLDGIDAAIHWDNRQGFAERFPDLCAVDRLFTLDRGRLTCAGGAAILDMMVTWIAALGHADIAREVADHLLFAAPRAGQTAQRSTSGMSGPAAPTGADGVVAAAQAIMRAHVEEPLPCAAIARQVGVSLRQLERRFARVLDRSPVQVYLQLRLARAHQLLQQTEASVTDVAVACGFESRAYFSRIYRKTFGCAPSRDRRQTTSAPVFRSAGLGG